MEVAAKFPGLTGLFISGIVSAALRYYFLARSSPLKVSTNVNDKRATCFSTMSAQLNTVSGTIYEDFVVKMMGISVSELTASVIMKCTVVIVGTTCVALVIVVERLKGIFQVNVGQSNYRSLLFSPPNVLDVNEPDERDVRSVDDSIHTGRLLSVCQRQSECPSLKWKTLPFYKSRVIDKRPFLRSGASVCDRAFENRWKHTSGKNINTFRLHSCVQHYCTPQYELLRFQSRRYQGRRYGLCEPLLKYGVNPIQFLLNNIMKVKPWLGCNV